MFCFFNFPQYVALKEYHAAISRMVQKLSRFPGVVSIFQIGSISTPGISDIDLLIVFEDKVKCDLNPLESLRKSERYFFTHELYGVSVSSFLNAQMYTFFHNYKLLWGQDLLSINSCILSGDAISDLKIQTALEYLIKMLINMTIKYNYKIFNIRSLMLHVKALVYDLEFLNVTSGPLYDLVYKMVEWRTTWFENPPSKQQLSFWIREFNDALSFFLEKTLSYYRLYINHNSNIRLIRNVTISPSNRFYYTHRGLILPGIFGKLSKKYVNLQHRFNEFTFYVPTTHENIPDIIKRRFDFIRIMTCENKNNFTYFMPLFSHLNVY